jgi:hypothetical protein
MKHAAVALITSAMLLAGCAAPPATETAASTGCAADVVDTPFVGGLLGLALDPQIAEENTRRRQEARAHEPAGCPAQAARPAPTPPTVHSWSCLYGYGFMSCN